MISLEYLAGFFDGEGYVGVGHFKKSDNYHLCLTITNSDNLILEAIRLEYGGHIYSKGDKRKKTYHDTYSINWFGKDAKDMAKSLLPYSHIKSSQLKLALTFPTGKQLGVGKRLEEIDKNTQKSIYHELKHLKQEIGI